MGGERLYPEQPDPPIELLPEMAAFLCEQGVACLMQSTDRGMVYVIKLPLAEIMSVRGRVPVQVRHELYQLPTAPVIRTLLGIYDQPESALKLETFTNVADEVQRNDFAALAQQRELILLFYDEALSHRLTKLVPQERDEDMLHLLSVAERILAQIPTEQFDFDRAKQIIVERTEL